MRLRLITVLVDDDGADTRLTAFEGGREVAQRWGPGVVEAFTALAVELRRLADEDRARSTGPVIPA